MLNNYSECFDLLLLPVVIKVKADFLFFFAFVLFFAFFFCYFVFSMCSQHGYIFLAGAVAKPPDERISGRHTEYRLIKYGY